MIDHADIGSFVSACLAHRVREKFTADADFFSLGSGSLDDCFDAFIRDGGFYKDGGEVGFDEELNELFDSLHSGFRFGADPLNSADLNSVGAAEVGEGIVSGDKRAVFFRNGGETAARHLIKMGKLGGVGGEIFLVIRRVGGIELCEASGDFSSYEGPRLDVHPDVGVGFGGSADDLVVALEESFRHGVDGFPFRLLALQNLAHLAFEMKTVVKNEIGLIEEIDVSFRGHEGVGVDALADEIDDISVLACDLASDVCNHADGGSDLKRIIGGSLACRFFLNATDG